MWNFLCDEFSLSLNFGFLLVEETVINSLECTRNQSDFAVQDSKFDSRVQGDEGIGGKVYLWAWIAPLQSMPTNKL